MDEGRPASSGASSGRDTPVAGMRRRGGRGAALARSDARPERTHSAGADVNTWRLTPGDPKTRTLVIACGALIAELRQVIELNRLDHVEVTGIPADYHVTPERITAAVEAKIRWARGRYARILVGYGDCGTRGALDAMLAAEQVERIEGAHCYAFFAGLDTFDRMHDAAPGTFYLTDFLARHFDALTVRGLGIDRHPDLKASYFGNYTRVVYLAQVPTPERLALAQSIADWFGLPLHTEVTGLAGLDRFLSGHALPHDAPSVA